jgi:hypothetical protein
MQKQLRRKRRKVVFTKGVAHLANSVELTKLKSENSMTIEIRSRETLLGTLILGRGSVQWWPSGPRERCEEELETVCGFA